MNSRHGSMRWMYGLTAGMLAVAPLLAQQQKGAEAADLGEPVGDEQVLVGEEALGMAVARVWDDEGWEFSVGAALVRSAGEAGFVIGYEPYGKISELEYPLDGTLAALEGNLGYRFWMFGIGGRGRFVSGMDVGGTSTDSDWLDQNNRSLRTNYSESDSDADVTIWELDAQAVVKPFYYRGPGVLRSLCAGLSLGYGQQSFDFTDTGLRAWYYGTYYSEPDGTLVSTYDVEFTGMRVGLLASIEPVQGLNVGIDVVYMPWLSAESEAYWVLRDYPFSQSAEGYGFLGGVDVSYTFWRQMRVFSKLRYTYLRGEDGTESGVEDGESYTDWDIVPRISAQYMSIELGLGGAF